MAARRYKVVLRLSPMDASVDEAVARRQVLAAVQEKFPGLCPKVVVKDA